MVQKDPPERVPIDAVSRARLTYNAREDTRDYLAEARQTAKLYRFARTCFVLAAIVVGSYAAMHALGNVARLLP